MVFKMYMNFSNSAERKYVSTVKITPIPLPKNNNNSNNTKFRDPKIAELANRYQRYNNPMRTLFRSGSTGGGCGCGK